MRVCSVRVNPMQTLLILLLFVAALTYLGWRSYQSFSMKKAGCGKGCGCAETPVKRA
jgi:cytochrome c-type biogenesis protein CcmH/NrfG